MSLTVHSAPVSRCSTPLGEITVTTTEEIKKKLGAEAAKLVENGMVVGLGSGSTARYFIESLIGRKKAEGLRFRAVASSGDSFNQALAGGITMLTMEEFSEIDLLIGGADEVDRNDNMIKGGGGALFREKLLAAASKRIVIIVDESKLVEYLGQCGLPVEIVSAGHQSTIKRLEEAGYRGEIRMESRREFVTENGNLIFDIKIPTSFPAPQVEHQKIKQTLGVVETGFFLDLKSEVFAGFSNGRVCWV